MNRTRLFGMLAGAAAAALTVSPVYAQTDVKFALDWKFEGPSAPYFVAIDKGYYKAEGLNVTIDSGPGSVAGIARVAAGTYPIGFFDINSLVKFRDQNPDKKVQAVLMMYDKPAFAIGTTAKTGIVKPKDLEGRVLGAPAADGAFAQWKAFVKENGIDESKVKIENVGFPVREPMLAEGKVDAITGFSFSMYYNLLQKGIKPEDIKVMLMADHGLVLYGNAIMVNPDYAKANPQVVNVGFPVREPMLAEGKVDAITGFSFSMYYNLLQKGIKPEDIKVMLMADHGLVLYGNAIMVNPDYAKANPQVVAGFVRATIKGVLDTVKDPDTAIKSVMTRNETGDPKIELERLKMSLRDNFVTPWVKANGFGGVDMARLAKSIDQIALTYEFKNRPTEQDIFTSQYLPPAAERKL